MKKLISMVLVTIGFMSFNTYAGNPPRVDPASCVNVGNTIRVVEGPEPGRSYLHVLVHKVEKKGVWTDEFEKINLALIDITESDSKVIAEEKRGCTTRKVFTIKVTFTPKNKDEPMPDAYNRLAEEDGSLNDYFLCSESHAWTPPPGQDC